MRGSIIECEDLLAITGYEKPGDAARSLRKQGIRVFDGKAGIWTTLELINAAGGIMPAPAKDDAVSPEEIA
jgi:hypothetical protein